MSAPIRGQLVAGSLLAAAALFAAGRATGAGQDPLPDAPDAHVEGEKAETGKAGSAEKAETDADVVAESVSPDGAGEMNDGDYLFGLSTKPLAHARRGTDTVRLRGVFWTAFPFPAPAPEHPADTLARRNGTRVTLHALDLTDTAHDRRIPGVGVRLAFPPSGADSSTVGVPGTGLPVRWVAKVPLSGVPSGTYRGYLLATRAGESVPRRAPAAIPLVVYVKDSPWPALLILLLGLPVVLLLRWYAARRRTRDERLVRLGDTAARIEEDPLLRDPSGVGVPFRAKFSMYLRAAAAALKADGDTALADANLKRANALWVAWEEGKPDWEAGLRQDREHIDQLAAIPAPSPHAAALLRDLRSGYAGAPADVPPDENATAANPGAAAATAYRAAAERRAARVARYLGFLRELQAVRAEAAGIPDAAKRAALVAELDRIQQAWEAFAQPADDAVSETTLTAFRGEVAAARRAAGLPDPTGSGLVAAQEGTAAHRAGGPPDTGLIPAHFLARIRAARDRARAFVWVLTVIVYTLLVLYGFRETWVRNPEFGADRLEDYLGVFAWAMGVNVVITGLAAFIDQWALPWLPGATTNTDTDG